ncbi:MAG: hypothetical protein Q8O01_05615 [Candidatus Omnitrophota bacterium]|nr:hypothetical protein [Candidatus Omnitrophota bacterium]
MTQKNIICLLFVCTLLAAVVEPGWAGREPRGGGVKLSYPPNFISAPKINANNLPNGVLAYQTNQLNNQYQAINVVEDRTLGKSGLFRGGVQELNGMPGIVGTISYNPDKFAQEQTDLGGVLAHEFQHASDAYPLLRNQAIIGGLSAIKVGELAPMQAEIKYRNDLQDWNTDGANVQAEIAKSLGLGQGGPAVRLGNFIGDSAAFKDAARSAQQYSSPQDAADIKQIEQYGLQIYDISRTVASRGSTMSRAEAEQYQSQLVGLKQKVDATAIGMAQRNQIRIPENSYPQMPSAPYQPKTMEDFGIDVSKIDETHLQDNAVLEVAHTTSTLAASMALPGVGLATMLVGAGIQVHDISNVATGQADPHAIEGIALSPVMGYDIIKGNKNLPTQTSITSINTNYNDGALQQHIQGVKMIKQNFSTNEPGVIGNYGFGSGDKTTTSTSQQSVTHTTFSGSSFNENYRNK